MSGRGGRGGGVVEAREGGTYLEDPKQLLLARRRVRRAPDQHKLLLHAGATARVRSGAVVHGLLCRGSRVFDGHGTSRKEAGGQPTLAFDGWMEGPRGWSCLCKGVWEGVSQRDGKGCLHLVCLLVGWGGRGESVCGCPPPPPFALSPRTRPGVIVRRILWRTCPFWPRPPHCPHPPHTCLDQVR